MDCSECKNNKNQPLTRCKRCTLPITWETIYFDKQGICNICRNWEVKKNRIDWNEREKQFQKIIKEIKQKKASYDCVVPFSGGKDSTYTLWRLIKIYRLKPLVVSFDHGFYRPITLLNRTKTFRKLGVDVITFTPNWKIVKKLMFESLFRKGDFCWHCHVGITAYPMQIAVKFKIPLVIWGEGGGEYEGYFKFSELEETDEWKFNRRANIGIRAEDMAGFLDLELRDLEPYLYPTKKELRRIKSLPLGKFIPWDVKKQVKIIKKELDWQEDEIESGYPGKTYEKIECMFTGIRDYIKYIKRGFARITHLTTLDIRHGRLKRKKAIELINKYEGRKPRSLELFLNYLGISEAEFNKIILKHIIPPAVKINPKSLKYGKILKDQKNWYRE